MQGKKYVYKYISIVLLTEMQPMVLLDMICPQRIQLRKLDEDKDEDKDEDDDVDSEFIIIVNVMRMRIFI